MCTTSCLCWPKGKGHWEGYTAPHMCKITCTIFHWLSNNSRFLQKQIVTWGHSNTTHFPLTWHFSLHSELSSSHVSWHKLEIDNRNLFNICQLKNTLLYFDYFTPGLANNLSCSKGSGFKSRKWRFSTCREGVTICGKPHLPLCLLFLL